ncbi:hypothetical protein [Pseudocitrobacter cyperus]|uniref:Uncharacterized protein n=1 Tax=Pseudocitrobacter cyperus TaxID=3112843 RepID=A0ABV0HHG0_9ENTR
MKPTVRGFLVLPFLFSPIVEAAERIDDFRRISFHSPSNSGFRTASILTVGFTGATVTMSSNHEALNLNDVVFSVAHDWLEIKPHSEGRVTLYMKRQPLLHEKSNTLTLHNRKTGNTQHYDFNVHTWLVGEGAIDNSFTAARERCERNSGRLLTTREFRDVSRKWFGLSKGQLSVMYPQARLFHPQAQAGGSFWVHEAKALFLHTGIKSHQRGINTICRYEYESR